MRLPTLLAVLVLTSVVLFLAGWFHPKSKTMATLPPAPAVPLEEAATVNVAPPRLDPSAPSALPVMADMDAANPQAVEDRIAELETLALSDDTNALNLILVALADINPEIREAALESTIQFGSPDAIPTLQYILTKTDAAEEKVKIQEAIKFLMLPPLATSALRQP